jgi:hypothetical protein
MVLARFCLYQNKNAMKKVKNILLLILLLAFAVPQVSYAQGRRLTKKEIRKIERRKPKVARLKASLRSRAYYANLLKHHFFVFQADRLYGPGGMSYSVSPDVNFFAVVKNKVILQFGFQGIVGWNGVGGLTAEGFLAKYNFSEGKSLKRALTVAGNIRPRGGGGQPYFYMTINNNGNAYLEVLMIGGGRIRMSGHVVAPSQAAVYKGHSRF